MNEHHEIVKPTPPFPFWLNVFKIDKQLEYVAPHWHRGIEISFTAYGKIDEFKIGTESFQTHPGQILLVNSEEIHQIEIKPGFDNESLGIIFPYDYIYRLYPEIGHYYFDLNHPQYFSSQQKIAYAKLQGLLFEIMEVFKGETSFRNVQLMKLINEVLLIVITSFSKKKEEETHRRKAYEIRRLQQITSYVNDNYDQKITLDELADICNVSKEYLARFFKKQMGITISRYINNVRAQHANDQLLGKRGNLSKVAIHNGFSGIKSMNRAFKALYGQTASEIYHQRKK